MESSGIDTEWRVRTWVGESEGPKGGSCSPPEELAQIRSSRCAKQSALAWAER